MPLVISEYRVIHTYCRAFGSGAVTTCFYEQGLSRLRFEHPTFRLRGERSKRMRHRRSRGYVKLGYKVRDPSEEHMHYYVIDLG